MGNSSFFHGARFKTAESALAQSYGSTPNQKRSPFTVPHPQLCNPAHLLPLWRAPCLWPGGRLFAASCLMRSCSDTKRVEKYRCHSSPHNILYNDPWWCLRLGYSKWQTGFPTFGNDIFPAWCQGDQSKQKPICQWFIMWHRDVRQEELGLRRRLGL